MNNIVLSILLGIAGIFIGIVVTILINHFRVNSARDKINKYKEKAQKEAEKVKRDLLFAAKEESHKLKMDTEKDIKDI